MSFLTNLALTTFGLDANANFDCSSSDPRVVSTTAIDIQPWLYLLLAATLPCHQATNSLPTPQVSSTYCLGSSHAILVKFLTRSYLQENEKAVEKQGCGREIKRDETIIALLLPLSKPGSRCPYQNVLLTNEILVMRKIVENLWPYPNVIDLDDVYEDENWVHVVLELCFGEMSYRPRLLIGLTLYAYDLFVWVQNMLSEFFH